MGRLKHEALREEVHCVWHPKASATVSLTSSYRPPQAPPPDRFGIRNSRPANGALTAPRSDAMTCFLLPQSAGSAKSRRSGENGQELSDRFLGIAIEHAVRL